jgi:polysaccharide biosynthesis/export protein
MSGRAQFYFILSHAKPAPFHTKWRTKTPFQQGTKMKMIKILLLVVIGFETLLAVASAQDQIAADVAKESSADVVAPASKTFQERYPRYKLAPGDAFDISFELNPEFNQSVVVQPDGYITLRGVGDVQVAGLTVPELTTTLRTAYDKILNQPLVSVLLKDFQKPYFIADGQVARPGKYDLRGETSLTQAIAMAGGFLDSSKHSQVLLFRKASEGWYSAKIFDVKKMEKEGNLREDPQLRPGDMLFVPRNRFSKVKAFLPTSNVGAYTRPF